MIAEWWRALLLPPKSQLEVDPDKQRADNIQANDEVAEVAKRVTIAINGSPTPLIRNFDIMRAMFDQRRR